MMVEYLKTRDVMEMFGWKSRFMVSQVARREGWDKVPGSRPRLYALTDVLDYAVSREHSRKVRAMGGIVYGLIRHKYGYSPDCPVCKEILSNRV